MDSAPATTPELDLRSNRLTAAKLRLLDSLRADSAETITARRDDIRALMDITDEARHDEQYWRSVAIYLADLHAANGWEAAKKSASKSFRGRLRSIMVTSLNLITGTSDPAFSPHRNRDRLDSVAKRLRDEIGRLPET